MMKNYSGTFMKFNASALTEQLRDKRKSKKNNVKGYGLLRTQRSNSQPIPLSSDHSSPSLDLATELGATNTHPPVQGSLSVSTEKQTSRTPSPSVVSHSPTVRTDSTPRDQASSLSHLESAFEMRAMQPPSSNTHASSHLSPSYDAHISNSDASKPSLSTQSSQVFKPEEISSIQQNIRAKGCIVTFNSNGTADKITGPNPVEAVQHCGNPIFKQGPFSLNFNVDLQNPALVQKMKEKVNALLQSVRDSNIPHEFLV